jgi:hypothetical protein
MFELFTDNNNIISSDNNDYYQRNNRENVIISQEEKPKKSFINKIGTFFEKTKDNIEIKLKEMKIGEKAKDIANTTKTFVTEQSKNIMV